MGIGGFCSRILQRDANMYTGPHGDRYKKKYESSRMSQTKTPKPSILAMDCQVARQLEIRVLDVVMHVGVIHQKSNLKIYFVLPRYYLESMNSPET